MRCNIADVKEKCVMTRILSLSNGSLELEQCRYAVRNAKLIEISRLYSFKLVKL